jgi:NitT/TauT family transport system substrate-binding protein
MPFMLRALCGLVLGAWLVIAACGRTDSRPGAVANPSPAPATNPAAPPAAQPRSAASVDSEPLRPPVTVRLGQLRGTSDAGIFIAQQKGYFREEGIELDASVFQSAQVMVAPLAAGQLDVGAGALSAALVNAVGRDVPIKVVADKGSVPPGFSFQALVVRKDLVDSGRFRGCEHFRGLKVAVSAPGVTLEPALDRALRDCGLSIADVDVTPMGFPDMVVALRGGALDGAMMIEPFLTTAITDGSAVIYKRTEEFYPSQQIAVILYGPHFIANQRPAANRFMVAYLKGVRDHYDAFTRGKNKAEIIDILARTTGVSDPALFERMTPPGLNPDGYVNLRSMNDDIEWWVNHGYLGSRIDAAQLVDNSFVDYALDRLGSYVAR